uniref:USP domain-containing protein n=1 Tax=Rhabditophanes sp. KR3021 TaxID=114890 RepID=A0AC35TUF9_9BILA
MEETARQLTGLEDMARHMMNNASTPILPLKSSAFPLNNSLPKQANHISNGFIMPTCSVSHQGSSSTGDDVSQLMDTSSTPSHSDPSSFGQGNLSKDISKDKANLRSVSPSNSKALPPLMRGPLDLTAYQRVQDRNKLEGSLGVTVFERASRDTNKRIMILHKTGNVLLVDDNEASLRHPIPSLQPSLYNKNILDKKMTEYRSLADTPQQKEINLRECDLLPQLIPEKKVNSIIKASKCFPPQVVEGNLVVVQETHKSNLTEVVKKVFGDKKEPTEVFCGGKMIKMPDPSCSETGLDKPMSIDNIPECSTSRQTLNSYEIVDDLSAFAIVSPTSTLNSDVPSPYLPSKPSQLSLYNNSTNTLPLMVCQNLTVSAEVTTLPPNFAKQIMSGKTKRDGKTELVATHKESGRTGQVHEVRRDMKAEDGEYRRVKLLLSTPIMNFLNLKESTVANRKIEQSSVPKYNADPKAPIMLCNPHFSNGSNEEIGEDSENSDPLAEMISARQGRRQQRKIVPRYGEKGYIDPEDSSNLCKATLEHVRFASETDNARSAQSVSSVSVKSNEFDPQTKLAFNTVINKNEFKAKILTAARNPPSNNKSGGSKGAESKNNSSSNKGQSSSKKGSGSSKQGVAAQFNSTPSRSPSPNKPQPSHKSDKECGDGKKSKKRAAQKKGESARHKDERNESEQPCPEPAPSSLLVKTANLRDNEPPVRPFQYISDFEESDEEVVSRSSISLSSSTDYSAPDTSADMTQKKKPRPPKSEVERLLDEPFYQEIAMLTAQTHLTDAAPCHATRSSYDTRNVSIVTRPQNNIRRGENRSNSRVTRSGNTMTNTGTTNTPQYGSRSGSGTSQRSNTATTRNESRSVSRISTNFSAPSSAHPDRLTRSSTRKATTVVVDETPRASRTTTTTSRQDSNASSHATVEASIVVTDDPTSSWRRSFRRRHNDSVSLKPVVESRRNEATGEAEEEDINVEIRMPEIVADAPVNSTTSISPDHSSVNLTKQKTSVPNISPARSESGVPPAPDQMLTKIPVRTRFCYRNSSILAGLTRSPPRDMSLLGSPFTFGNRAVISKTEKAKFQRGLSKRFCLLFKPQSPERFTNSSVFNFVNQNFTELNTSSAPVLVDNAATVNSADKRLNESATNQATPRSNLEKPKKRTTQRSNEKYSGTSKKRKTADEKASPKVVRHQEVHIPESVNTQQMYVPDHEIVREALVPEPELIQEAYVSEPKRIQQVQTPDLIPSGSGIVTRSVVKRQQDPNHTRQLYADEYSETEPSPANLVVSESNVNEEDIIHMSLDQVRASEHKKSGLDKDSNLPSRPPSDRGNSNASTHNKSFIKKHKTFRNSNPRSERHDEDDTTIHESPPPPASTLVCNSNGVSQNRNIPHPVLIENKIADPPSNAQYRLPPNSRRNSVGYGANSLNGLRQRHAHRPDPRLTQSARSRVHSVGRESSGNLADLRRKRLFYHFFKNSNHPDIVERPDPRVLPSQSIPNVPVIYFTIPSLAISDSSSQVDLLSSSQFGTKTSSQYSGPRCGLSHLNRTSRISNFHSEVPNLYQPIQSLNYRNTSPEFPVRSRICRQAPVNPARSRRYLNKLAKEADARKAQTIITTEVENVALASTMNDRNRGDSEFGDHSSVDVEDEEMDVWEAAQVAVSPAMPSFVNRQFLHEHLIITDAEYGVGNGFEQEQQIVSEDEPQIVAQVAPQIGLEDESQIVSENEPQIVSEDEPRIVSEDEPQIVSEDEPQIVSEDESEPVSENEPDLVSENEPELVNEDELIIPLPLTHQITSRRKDSENTDVSDHLLHEKRLERTNDERRVAQMCNQNDQLLQEINNQPIGENRLNAEQQNAIDEEEREIAEEEYRADLLSRMDRFDNIITSTGQVLHVPYNPKRNRYAMMQRIVPAYRSDFPVDLADGMELEWLPMNEASTSHAFPRFSLSYILRPTNYNPDRRRTNSATPLQHVYRNEPRIVSEDEPQIVSEDESEPVSENEPDLVSENEPELVNEDESIIPLPLTPQITSRRKDSENTDVSDHLLHEKRLKRTNDECRVAQMCNQNDQLLQEINNQPIGENRLNAEQQNAIDEEEREIAEEEYRADLLSRMDRFDNIITSTGQVLHVPYNPKRNRHAMMQRIVPAYRSDFPVDLADGMELEWLPMNEASTSHAFPRFSLSYILRPTNYNPDRRRTNSATPLQHVYRSRRTRNRSVSQNRVTPFIHDTRDRRLFDERRMREVPAQRRFTDGVQEESIAQNLTRYDDVTLSLLCQEEFESNNQEEFESNNQEEFESNNQGELRLVYNVDSYGNRPSSTHTESVIESHSPVIQNYSPVLSIEEHNLEMEAVSSNQETDIPPTQARDAEVTDDLEIENISANEGVQQDDVVIEEIYQDENAATVEDAHAPNQEDIIGDQESAQQIETLQPVDVIIPSIETEPELHANRLELDAAEFIPDADQIIHEQIPLIVVTEQTAPIVMPDNELEEFFLSGGSQGLTTPSVENVIQMESDPVVEAFVPEPSPFDPYETSSDDQLDVMDRLLEEIRIPANSDCETVAVPSADQNCDCQPELNGQDNLVYNDQLEAAYDEFSSGILNVETDQENEYPAITSSDRETSPEEQSILAPPTSVASSTPSSQRNVVLPQVISVSVSDQSNPHHQNNSVMMEARIGEVLNRIVNDPVFSQQLDPHAAHSSDLVRSFRATEQSNRLTGSEELCERILKSIGHLPVATIYSTQDSAAPPMSMEEVTDYSNPLGDGVSNRDENSVSNRGENSVGMTSGSSIANRDHVKKHENDNLINGDVIQEIGSHDFTLLTLNGQRSEVRDRQQLRYDIIRQEERDSIKAYELRIMEKAEHERHLRNEEEAKNNEIKRIEEEEKKKLEELARLKAEEGARLKAEEEARLKAEEEARLEAEEEARLKAEEEARLKAELQAKIQEELEADYLEHQAIEIQELPKNNEIKRIEEEEKKKLEELARLKAEEEARLKAEEEARLEAEEEARLKAEEEARLKAEKEARLRAELQAKIQEELEADYLEHQAIEIQELRAYQIENDAHSLAYFNYVTHNTVIAEREFTHYYTERYNELWNESMIENARISEEWYAEVDEEIRVEAERIRLEEEAKMEAERIHLEEKAKIEAERIRLAEIARLKEEASLRTKAMVSTIRAARKAALRKAKLLAEKLRLDEAEKARLLAEKLKVEEAKKARLLAKKLKVEEAEKTAILIKKLKLEEAEKASIGAPKLRFEEAEKAKILAEQAEEEKSSILAAAEKIIFEEAEKVRILAEAKNAKIEEAKAQRIRVEEAENARILAEKAYAEGIRFAEVEAEKARIAEAEADAEKARISEARMIQETDNARKIAEEDILKRIKAKTFENYKELLAEERTLNLPDKEDTRSSPKFPKTLQNEQSSSQNLPNSGAAGFDFTSFANGSASNLRLEFYTENAHVGIVNNHAPVLLSVQSTTSKNSSKEDSPQNNSTTNESNVSSDRNTEVPAGCSMTRTLVGVGFNASSDLLKDSPRTVGLILTADGNDYVAIVSPSANDAEVNHAQASAHEVDDRTNDVAMMLLSFSGQTPFNNGQVPNKKVLNQSNKVTAPAEVKESDIVEDIPEDDPEEDHHVEVIDKVSVNESKEDYRLRVIEPVSENEPEEDDRVKFIEPVSGDIDAIEELSQDSDVEADSLNADSDEGEYHSGVEDAFKEIDQNIRLDNTKCKSISLPDDNGDDDGDDEESHNESGDEHFDDENKRQGIALSNNNGEAEYAEPTNLVESEYIRSVENGSAILLETEPANSSDGEYNSDEEQSVPVITITKPQNESERNPSTGEVYSEDNTPTIMDGAEEIPLDSSIESTAVNHRIDVPHLNVMVSSPPTSFQHSMAETYVDLNKTATPSPIHLNRVLHTSIISSPAIENGSLNDDDNHTTLRNAQSVIIINAFQFNSLRSFETIDNNNPNNFSKGNNIVDESSDLKISGLESKRVLFDQYSRTIQEATRTPDASASPEMEILEEMGQLLDNDENEAQFSSYSSGGNESYDDMPTLVNSSKSPIDGHPMSGEETDRAMILAYSDRNHQITTQVNGEKVHKNKKKKYRKYIEPQDNSPHSQNLHRQIPKIKIRIVTSSCAEDDAVSVENGQISNQEAAFDENVLVVNGDACVKKIYESSIKELTAITDGLRNIRHIHIPVGATHRSLSFSDLQSLKTSAEENFLMANQMDEDNEDVPGPSKKRALNIGSDDEDTPVPRKKRAPRIASDDEEEVIRERISKPVSKKMNKIKNCKGRNNRSSSSQAAISSAIVPRRNKASDEERLPALNHISGGIPPPKDGFVMYGIYKVKVPEHYVPPAAYHGRPILQTCPKINFNAAALRKSLPKTSDIFPKTRKKIRGIKNTGNICYINSVIQCLVNLVDFKQQILKYRGVMIPKELEFELTIQFVEIMYELDLDNQSVSTKALNIEKFVTLVIKMRPKTFLKGIEGDSIEFLDFLLDNIEHQIDNYIAITGSTLVNPISLFRAQIIREEVCERCFSSEYHVDYVNALSLNAPEETGRGLVCDLLENWLFEKFKFTLERSSCAVCNHTHKFQRHHLYKLPQILILNVQRTFYHQITNNYRKSAVEAKCDVMNFYIALFLHINSPDFYYNTVFRLNSAIEHSGRTATSGHYSSLIRKNVEDWFKCDDNQISTARQPTVSQASIYFFELYNCTAEQSNEAIYHKIRKYPTMKRQILAAFGFTTPEQVRQMTENGEAMFSSRKIFDRQFISRNNLIFSN